MRNAAGAIQRIRRRAAREHWPKASGPALAYQGAATAAIDVYLLWLVLRGLATPLSLVAFSVVELLLLTVFAKAELLAVPRASRFSAQRHALLGAEERSGLFGRLFVCVFMAIWLTIVYAFSLFADENVLLLISDRDPLDILARLDILGPLLLCALLGLIAMLGDWHLWHRRGGLFLPELAQPNVPKILAFLIAPLPAIMACFTFIDDDGATALFAWCVAYLAIRIVFELGMFGIEIFGFYILDGTDEADSANASAQAA